MRKLDKLLMIFVILIGFYGTSMSIFGNDNGHLHQIEDDYYVVKSTPNFETFSIDDYTSKEASEYAYTVENYVTRLKAKEIISQIIKPEMTDLEKEIAIHDYIVLNTVYDYDNYINRTLPQTVYSAYGCLVLKSAVCSGYARAFELLCTEVGLECIYLSSPSMNHAWNLIQLDGQWYHVDTTWDDPVRDRPGKTKYKYFNLSDSEMSQDHSWDTNKYSACPGAFNDFNSPGTSAAICDGKFLYTFINDDEAGKNKFYKYDLMGNVILESGDLSGTYSSLIGLYKDYIYYYNNTSTIYRVKKDGAINELICSDIDFDNYSKATLVNGLLTYYVDEVAQTIDYRPSTLLDYIMVNDHQIELVNESIDTYTYELPWGDKWPEVTVTPVSEEATVELAIPETFPGTVTITISDVDNNESIYYLNVTTKDTSDHLEFTLLIEDPLYLLSDFELFEEIVDVNGEISYQLVEEDMTEYDAYPTADGIKVKVKLNESFEHPLFLSMKSNVDTVYHYIFMPLKNMVVNENKVIMYYDLVSQVTVVGDEDLTGQCSVYSFGLLDEKGNIIKKYYSHFKPKVGLPKGRYNMTFSIQIEDHFYFCAYEDYAILNPNIVVDITSDNLTRLNYDFSECISEPTKVEHYFYSTVNNYSYNYSEAKSGEPYYKYGYVLKDSTVNYYNSYAYFDNQLVLKINNGVLNTDHQSEITFAKNLHLIKNELEMSYEPYSTLDASGFKIIDDFGYEYTVKFSGWFGYRRGSLELWKDGQLYSKDHLSRQTTIGPADGGSYEYTYRVDYSPVPIEPLAGSFIVSSTNNHEKHTLDKLLINGQSLEGFNPNRTIYYINKADYGDEIILDGVYDQGTINSTSYDEYAVISLSSVEGYRIDYLLIYLDYVVDGDVTGDGIVNEADFRLMVNLYGLNYREQNFYDYYDVIKDGIIDYMDIIMMMK